MAGKEEHDPLLLPRQPSFAEVGNTQLDYPGLKEHPSGTAIPVEKVAAAKSVDRTLNGIP